MRQKKINQSQYAGSIRNEHRSAFDLTSTRSPSSQKFIPVGNKQLKKINTKLSELCSELDIDDEDIQIDIGLGSNTAVIHDNSTNYSHIPIVIQAVPRSPTDPFSPVSIGK